MTKRKAVIRLPKTYQQPNDDPLMREGEAHSGFVQLWNDWMDATDGQLTSVEFHTAIWIMRYQGRNEWAYPSYATLAEKVGTKKRWIIEIIQSLERKQIIKVGRRKGRINRYKIIEKLELVHSSAPVHHRTPEQMYTSALQDTNPCTPVHPPVHSSAPPSEAYTEKQTQEADSLERVCTPAESVVETRRADAAAPLDTRSRVSSPIPSYRSEEEECKALYDKYREWLLPQDRNNLTVLRQVDKRARARGVRL